LDPYPIPFLQTMTDTLTKPSRALPPNCDRHSHDNKFYCGIITIVDGIVPNSPIFNMSKFIVSRILILKVLR
jgi:hypothetical protein